MRALTAADGPPSRFFWLGAALVLGCGPELQGQVPAQPVDDPVSPQSLRQSGGEAPPRRGSPAWLNETAGTFAGS